MFVTFFLRCWFFTVGFSRAIQYDKTRTMQTVWNSTMSQSALITLRGVCLIKKRWKYFSREVVMAIHEAFSQRVMSFEGSPRWFEKLRVDYSPQQATPPPTSPQSQNGTQQTGSGTQGQHTKSLPQRSLRTGSWGAAIHGGLGSLTLIHNEYHY